MKFIDKLKLSGFFRANYIVGISTVSRIFTGVLKTKASALLLAPVGVGVLGIAGQMQMLLLSIGSLSFGSGIIQMLGRRISENNQVEKKRIFSTAFTLLFFFDLFLLGLGILALPWIAPLLFESSNASAYFLPVLFALPFGAFVVSYFQCILFTHGRYDLWSRANVAMAVFDLFLFVTLSWAYGVKGALWATGISMAFLAFMSLNYCLRLERARDLFTFGFSKTIALDLSRFTATGLLTGGLTYSFGIFLRVFLVRKFGADVNGSFQAICVISGFYTQLLTNGIWAQLFPMVSKATDSKELSFAWSESISMISCMGVLILSGLLIHPALLISTLFSKNFLIALEFFPLLLVGDFFYLVAQPSLGVMLGRKNLREYSLVWCGYFLILGSSMFFAAFQWGVIGIGIAHLLANFALAVVATAYYLRSRPIEGRNTVAYLLLLGSLLVAQFCLWEFFGGESALGFLLRGLCLTLTIVVAALGIFHYSGSESSQLSIKTNILNIFRSIFMLPFIEPLMVRLSSANKDNRWIFRSLPNHYQYPKPCIRKATRNGISYELDIADFIDWHIYFGYSEGTKIPLYEMISEGGIAIDVGANIGETALELAKRVGPSGRVFAFEPDPLMRNKFNKNFSFNQWAKIQLEPWALSDVAATHRLYRVSERNPAGNKIMSEGSGDFVEIQAIRLDDYVTQNQIENIDLVKIDVEGFEKHVLLGAGQVILRFMPKLFVEISQKQLQMQGTSAHDIFALLEGWGYLIKYAHNLVAVTSSSELESGHFDIIALPIRPKG
jgi:FkbM family methyltransferase